MTDFIITDEDIDGVSRMTDKKLTRKQMIAKLEKNAEAVYETYKIISATHCHYNRVTGIYENHQSAWDCLEAHDLCRREISRLKREAAND